MYIYLIIYPRGPWPLRGAWDPVSRVRESMGPWPGAPQGPVGPMGPFGDRPMAKDPWPNWCN